MVRPVAAIALLVFTLAAFLLEPTTRTPSYGRSEKVCQLTGDVDWRTKRATTTRTESQSGLIATDLGYPVEHGGRLALLFGDSRPAPPTVNETGPPDDAVGWISTRSAPTEGHCTDLEINHHERNGLKTPVSPTVVPAIGQPAIRQGIFNVPSGGVSIGGWLYAFFWTDHCNVDNTCKGTRDDGQAPFELSENRGRGVLARSNDDGKTFVDPVEMPPGFVYSTAVDSSVITNLPGGQRKGTYVFGVPRYRSSVPYLAHAPAGKMRDVSAWTYFTGLKPNGQPSWMSHEAWAGSQGGTPWTPPGHPELFAAEGAERCVGEFSVTWNRALRVWLLLYNCYLGKGPQSIVARIGDAPWGPWSSASIVLDPIRDGSLCTLLMHPTDPACMDLVDDWPDDPKKGPRQLGRVYAPFVMERYTTPEHTFVPGRRRAVVYWLVSTWNPYQVVVMRMTITVNDTWPTVRSIVLGRQRSAAQP